MSRIDIVFEDSRFIVRHIDPRPGKEYCDEVFDLNIDGDMTGAHGGHGGGDLRLVADFCRVVRGETPSLSTTALADSINGHRVCFCSDRAMREQKTVQI